MKTNKLNPKAEKELERLRIEINECDRLLILTLRNRFKIVKKIAMLKKKNNFPIYQKTRWKVIIENRIKMGERYKLNTDFTSAIMKLIHKESIRIQLYLQNKTERNKND